MCGRDGGLAGEALTVTVAMDPGAVVSVLGVTAIIVAAVVELHRTRTPRNWWHDLDKRVSINEKRLDILEDSDDD